MDNKEIDSTIAKLEENAKYIDTIIDDVVFENTAHLDSIMQDIYKEINANVGGLPQEMLCNYFMELTNLLYFISAKLEKVSVRSCLSKAMYNEAYNNIYLDITKADKKTTVAEKEATAENGAIKESTVQIIYESAQRKIKAKVEAGYEMVRTLSKIISKNMTETTLTKNKIGEEVA